MAIFVASSLTDESLLQSWKQPSGIVINFGDKQMSVSPVSENA